MLAHSSLFQPQKDRKHDRAMMACHEVNNDHVNELSNDVTRFLGIPGSSFDLSSYPATTKWIARVGANATSTQACDIAKSKLAAALSHLDLILAPAHIHEAGGRSSRASTPTNDTSCRPRNILITGQRLKIQVLPVPGVSVSVHWRRGLVLIFALMLRSPRCWAFSSRLRFVIFSQEWC